MHACQYKRKHWVIGQPACRKIVWQVLCAFVLPRSELGPQPELILYEAEEEHEKCRSIGRLDLCLGLLMLRFDRRCQLVPADSLAQVKRSECSLLLIATLCIDHCSC